MRHLRRIQGDGLPRALLQQMALACLIALLTLLALAVLAACAPATRSTTTHPAVAHAGTAHAPTLQPKAGSLGPLDPSRSLDVSFVLRTPTGLAQAVAASSDPGSAGYHRYLTPAQIAQQYGPTPADVERAQAVLRGAGLTVSSAAPHGVLLDARGTAGQLEALLGVRLLQYRAANGSLSFAPDGPLRLPASFSGAVTGVLGLDTRSSIHTGAVLAPASPLQPGGVTGYRPSDLAQAYDVTPLHQAGLDGSKQTIALAEIDTFNPADVQTYDAGFGISAPAVQVVKVNGGATTSSPEPELDIEVVQAIAPHANILVYESPQDLLSVARMLSQIVTDNRAQVLSVSLGTCEQQLDPSVARSFLSTLDNAFQRAAGQGMSVLVASGDNGAYDCQDNTLSVGAVAANPYVTAVGGTALFLSSGDYGHEAGWEGPLEGAGGGGGVSTIYQRPSWQTGPGIDNQYSSGGRQVPDVSADADPLTGYLIYYSTRGCSGEECWQVVGGTSAAAPLWAGLIVLANQQAQTQGKPRLGFLDPALYRLGAGASAGQVYHDVTQGGNLYYQATPSWDYSTGWGTPNAARLVSALVTLG